MKTMNELEILNDSQVAYNVNALVNVTEQVEVLKNEIERFKRELLAAMLKYEVKSTTIGSYKISVVDGVEPYDEEVKEFDVEQFMFDNPELYKKYIKTVTKHNNGRKTTIRFTKGKTNE